MGDQIVLVTPEDLAYFAGLFDGEGHISITRTKPNKKRRMISDRYYLSIGLGNIDFGIIMWIIDLFGGRFYGDKGTNFPVFKWAAAANIAKDILEQIYPYLKIKKWQAFYGIEFQNNCGGYVGRKGLTKEQLEQREDYKQIMKEAKNVYKFGCARRSR